MSTVRYSGAVTIRLTLRDGMSLADPPEYRCFVRDTRTGASHVVTVRQSAEDGMRLASDEPLAFDHAARGACAFASTCVPFEGMTRAEHERSMEGYAMLPGILAAASGQPEEEHRADIERISREQEQEERDAHAREWPSKTVAEDIANALARDEDGNVLVTRKRG